MAVKWSCSVGECFKPSFSSNFCKYRSLAVVLLKSQKVVGGGVFVETKEFASLVIVTVCFGRSGCEQGVFD